MRFRNVDTQAACCILGGISLEKNTPKISNYKSCHIKTSEKTEFTWVIQLCKKPDGITNIASVSEETPPPCGLFKVCMLPKSISLTMEENTEVSLKSHRRASFVACRMYVTLRIAQLPTITGFSFSPQSSWISAGAEGCLLCFGFPKICRQGLVRTNVFKSAVLTTRAGCRAGQVR